MLQFYCKKFLELLFLVDNSHKVNTVLVHYPNVRVEILSSLGNGVKFFLGRESPRVWARGET